MGRIAFFMKLHKTIDTTKFRILLDKKKGILYILPTFINVFSLAISYLRDFFLSLKTGVMSSSLRKFYESVG